MLRERRKGEKSVYYLYWIENRLGGYICLICIHICTFLLMLFSTKTKEIAVLGREPEGWGQGEERLLTVYGLVLCEDFDIYMFITYQQVF